MRLLRPCLCLLAALAAWPGCDDEPTQPDDALAITIVVWDAEGLPVAGVRVASMPAVPASFWSPPESGIATPFATLIPFSLPEPGLVRLEVRDVTGAAVRLLLDDVDLPAGQHEVFWDGRDDDGAPRPGHWYGVHLAVGDQVLDQSTILCVCDPDWHSLGETAADGRLVLTDRTLVPAFWSPPPLGDVTATTATLLRLEDADGASMNVTFDAIDGAQNVVVIWDPVDAPFAIELTVLEADGVTPVRHARIGGMPALPPGVWSPAPPARALVRIPLALAAASAVRLAVADVTGREVRSLVDGDLSAGRHDVLWDGRDDQQRPAPSGWYAVRFTAVAAGEPAVTDSTGLLMAVSGPDWHTWGTTDAWGRVVLSDPRLVPAFRDPPPLIRTNEEGATVGEYTLAPGVWLSVEGAGWVVLEGLTDGWQRLTATVRLSPEDGANQPVQGRDTGVPPPDSTRMLPPYPNPFN